MRLSPHDHLARTRGRPAGGEPHFALPAHHENQFTFFSQTGNREKGYSLKRPGEAPGRQAARNTACEGIMAGEIEEKFLVFKDKLENLGRHL